MARSTDPTTNQREIDVTDSTTRRSASDSGTTRGANAPEQRARDERRPTTAVGNGSAIAALVVGLLSATYAFLAVSAVAAILFGLVAIGLGAKGMGIAKHNGDLHKGLALSGIISGALGLLLGIAVIAGAITLGNQISVEDLPPAVQDAVQDVTN